MEINVVRVFVDYHGKFGNPVGIVVDDKHKFSADDKQSIATKLNFSETVFIDNLDATPGVSVFNPHHKVNFAGHAVLGTAYFLKFVLGKDIDSIKCWNENVVARFVQEKSFIVVALSILPEWNFKQLTFPSEIEQLSKASYSKMKHTFVWAWIGEAQGLVRARTFAPDWGILEDQANGSGSMLLASKLNCELEIHHGAGSLIFAKPISMELVEVGGLAKTDLSYNFAI